MKIWYEGDAVDGLPKSVLLNSWFCWAV